MLYFAQNGLVGAKNSLSQEFLGRFFIELTRKSEEIFYPKILETRDLL